MKLSIVPSSEYPRHELEINDWLAKEKEIFNPVNLIVLMRQRCLELMYFSCEKILYII